jgi:hypothetical protein
VEEEREGSSRVLESIGEVSKLKLHPPSTYFSLFYFVLNFFSFLSKIMSLDSWEESMLSLSLIAQNARPSSSSAIFIFIFYFLFLFFVFFFFHFLFCKSAARGVAKLKLN